MHLTIAAVLYQDALTVAIGFVLVSPRALATLQHHGVIVDMHVTAVDEHVGTYVDVDGV